MFTGGMIWVLTHGQVADVWTKAGAQWSTVSLGQKKRGLT